jgi:hypothetical protein
MEAQYRNEFSNTLNLCRQFSTGGYPTQYQNKESETWFIEIQDLGAPHSWQY